MKLSSLIWVIPAAVVALTPAPSDAAESKKTVTFRQVAPPYPLQHPPLNEQRTVRLGDIVYTERATGLPAARLSEKLVLKKTPAGRITVGPETDLLKYLVEGAPYFCGLFPIRDGKVEYGTVESDGWLELRKPGFYVCLADNDGDAGTFEKVRIITVVLKVVDRTKSLTEVKAVMHRFHEHTASGTVSAKAFSEATLMPDDGDYFEAVIRLKKTGTGRLEFQSDLLDKDGRQETRPASADVPASGPFPVMVSVPHPFEGDMLYRVGRSADAERDEEEKRRERAAHIEILKVEGDAVTYRVVRGFQPWRYWIEGPPRRAQKRMRWRPRP